MRPQPVITSRYVAFAETGVTGKWLAAALAVSRASHRGERGIPGGPSEIRKVQPPRPRRPVVFSSSTSTRPLPQTKKAARANPRGFHLNLPCLSELIHESELD